MSILPLQPSVVDAVRATIVIHSLEQCVNELVQNSLDAGATSIEVKVDASNFSLQVCDNGQGITRANLARIGPRYTLASIAEMSLLEITSKPRQQDHAYTALFRGGDRLLLEESSKPLRYEHGTVVSVRDLFFKFPVRQRQLSEQSSLQDIEGVKRTVEKLALAAPHVSFVTIDTFRDAKVVNLRKSDSLQSRIRTLLGPTIASSLIAVRSATVQDGGKSADISCAGFISTAGYYSQLHQHIFLNNRPIHSQAIQSAIHHVFQQSNFGKERSSVDSEGRRVKERHPVYVLTLTCRSDWYDIFADPAKTTVLFKEEERVVQLVRGMVIRFLLEQHFMSRTMAAKLLEQGSSSSSTTTARKRRRPGSLTSMVGVEEEAVPECQLTTECDPHLQLPHVRLSRSLRIVPPSSDASLEGDTDDWEDELYFELDSDWIHALTEDDFVPDDELDGSSTQGGTSFGPLIPPKPKLKRASLPPRTGSTRESSSHRLTSLLAQDALRKWVNPVLPTAPIAIPSVPALKPPSSTIGQPINMTSRGSRSEPAASTATFTLPATAGISSSASLRRSGYFQPAALEQGNHHHQQLLASVVLTKASIQKAEVIAQIDTKFILVTLEVQTKQQQPQFPSPLHPPLLQPPPPLSTQLPIIPSQSLRLKVLVAIDQHAAHERVRIERMMRQFCQCSRGSDSTSTFRSPSRAHTPSSSSTSTTTSLRALEAALPCQAESIAMLPPIRVTLTQREWGLARQFEERLFRWGIKVASKSMPWRTNTTTIRKGRKKKKKKKGWGGSRDEEQRGKEEDDYDEEQEEEDDGDDDDDEGDDDMEEEDMTETVSRHFTGLGATTHISHDYPSSGPAATAVAAAAEAASLLHQDNVQGGIVCLPRLIADRCVVDPGLAQDLIKETLAEMEATPFRIPSSGCRSKTTTATSQRGRCTTGSVSMAEQEDEDDNREKKEPTTSNYAPHSEGEGGAGDDDGGGGGRDQHAWVRCMRGCPRAILDILYSKACRGAIMFNDVLRKDECRDLVDDLGQCAFPFQCAHGRPSAVPLAILDQQQQQQQQQLVSCPGGLLPNAGGDEAVERRFREIRARTRGVSQWKQWLLSSSL
ncbi:DNA mismatch repair protein [Actinomortierella ambigua]|nr:DNA mismatch repair protein [Actinomortierella ambigua]